MEAPVRLEPAAAYASWFGVAPRRGRRAALTFAAADSRRPFLTSNEAMWRAFVTDRARPS